MKLKYYFAAALLSVSVMCGAQTQPDRTKQPAAGPAPRVELGKHVNFTLPNGLQVIVVEDHKLPKVSFSLRLDVDPVLEKENVGYVNAAGSLLRNGTKNRTKSQIDEEIDFIGASLSTGSTSVSGGCLTKHIGTFMPVFADVALNPVFPQEELDKWKKQTASELAHEKVDPGSIASNAGKALMFSDAHPYGEVMTEASVKTITSDMCRNYYNTFFKPNVAYLIMVGDIDVKMAKKLATQYFGNWKKAEVPKFTYPHPEQPKANRVVFVDKPGSVQSTIRIIYPIDLKPGSPDAIKARVTDMLLGGGGFSGRLFQNLREKHSYTYGAYSSIDSDPLVGSFTAEAEVRNAVTDSAITQFLVEMKRIVETQPTPDELTIMHNTLSGSFARSLERSGTLAEFAYNTLRYKLPVDYYDTYLEKVNAVTLDDVQQTAAKYVHPDNCIILVVGNKGEVADKLKKFSASGVVEFYDAQGHPVKSSDAVPEGLTTQKVLDAYITAVGGEKAINAVTSMAVDMKGSIQGRDIVLEQRWAKNKNSVTMKMGPMVLMRTVLNGEQAKQSGMQGSKDITGDELKDMILEANILPEITYASAGIATALKGSGDVNGTDCWQVEVTLPSGKKKIDFFDKKSGLKLRTLQTEDSPQGPVTVTVDYSDYKPVNGLMIPYSLGQSMGPMQLTFTADKVQINAGTTDADFAL
jgi:predicted Zn-dependent peptidase